VSLPRDDAAGDAVAGIACRIGLHVVRLGVNDQRRSTVGKQRVGLRTIAEDNRVVLDGGLRGAVGLDRKVRHVAGMVAIRILQPMLLIRGVEVTSGRFEVGQIALGCLMEVDGVFPGGQVPDVELQFDSGLLGLDGRGTDTLTLGVFQVDNSLLDGLGGLLFG